MSTFTASPIYEIDLSNELCSYDRIGLAEYDNTVNDSGYTYSGLTLVLTFALFTAHFDTTGHTYSNIILNNDVYTYTGLTGEIHYFQITDFYLGSPIHIDPRFGPVTQSSLIEGFTKNIISCVDKLDMLTGTCCPVQALLSNIPWVAITNEGGGVDNCDDYIARRTSEGWTLDFVFNKNGDPSWTESVFWFTGVRDEYDVLNYADNGLSFRFTNEGKILWTAYRYSGYCATDSGYTAMYYIDTGATANALCTGGTANDFNITITFERDNVYEDCAIENEGGWNDLVLWTGTTEELNSKWNNSRKLRLGTLKIYHNGRPVYKLKGFEEIVLSDRGYQPFTHVVGGGVTGSGGVHEGICCYDIKYAAYFEDVMDFVYLQNRYLTITSVNYNISECDAPCVPAIVMVTPTRTPSITPTVSRTPTVTRTPSLTPTVTRTPSVTPTPAGINSTLGLLYNAFTIDDPRNIAAPDWSVPTHDQLSDLKASVGTFSGPLKEVNTYPTGYWLTPNVGATNSTNFSARGAGGRTETGTFELIYEFTWFWTSTEEFGDNWRGQLRNDSNQFPIGQASKNRGNSIRLVRNSTTLLPGQFGTYTGNNGRVYKTVCISGATVNQEWMCGNLAETRYQNGDFIPEVRDNPTWSGLTTGAYCAYNNNWTYVYGIGPSPTVTPTRTPSLSISPTRTPSLTPSPSPLPPLELTFDSIANVPTGVTNPSSVTDWNTFFDLPTNGTPFTSVSIVGDTVNLYGGGGIALKDALFAVWDDDLAMYVDNTWLLSVNDQNGVITSAGSGAFNQCVALASASFPQLLTGNTYCFQSNISLSGISAPNMTTALDYCFFGCTSLDSPDFSSLLFVAESCFDSCTGLTNPNFSSLVGMGANCFINCHSLTNPNFDSLTIVGPGAFGFCKNLVNPDFIQHVTQIDTYSFQECSGLTNPSFSSLVIADDYAFWDCVNLIDIVLTGTTIIGDVCFGGCTSLTGITLPSCTNLGSTVGVDGVFNFITGNSITLTIPSALMTCNAGNPDGDINTLQINNSVTIIQV